MKNLAEEKKYGIPATGLATGEVRIAESPNFWVETGGSLSKACKAAGCVIEPETNDKVLLYIDPDGACYIISILLRNPQSPASMPFPDGLSIKIESGAFALESPDVLLASGGKLSLSGADLRIKATDGDVAVEKMAFRGCELKSSCDTIRLAARNIETVAGRLIQKLRRSYRTVEEFEESKIGRLRCIVNGMFFLKSKSTTVLAEKAVKMDGQKILLG
ncbi:MAG TPA: DUF3540 domain-containing protein [archaeon]|nr:DUF3540 domain-containing protein [archaeon]